MSTDLLSVVTYLSFLFIEKDYYVARSILSSTRNKLDGIAIGWHPIVKKLMRGVFNKNPPRLRYGETWNLNILEFLKLTGDNEVLDLMALSQKLTMLLALSLLLRVAVLVSIDLKSMA